MTATTIRPPRRLVRSSLAILAGFVSVVALSTGLDEVMHATGVFPPHGEPMRDNGLFALALAYRSVAGVIGSWVAARLAPHHPMRHALIVGGIGVVLASVGAIVTRDMGLGPAWYSWALVLVTLPAAWLGGRLHRGGGQ